MTICSSGLVNLTEMGIYFFLKIFYKTLLDKSGSIAVVWFIFFKYLVHYSITVSAVQRSYVLAAVIPKIIFLI